MTSLSKNSSITKAYINHAFSFLESDEYNPYKQYSDVPDDTEREVTTPSGGKNIISLNLDGRDHTKKTALHLTTSKGGGGGGLTVDKKHENRQHKKYRKGTPPKPKKQPVLAPYITSISVDDNNSQYARNIQQGAAVSTANVPSSTKPQNSGSTNDNTSKNDHQNGNAPPSIVAEKSKVSSKNGDILTSSLSSGVVYGDVVDGRRNKLTSESSSSWRCCTKQRCLYILVLVIVCLLIAGLVAGLVYAFGKFCYLNFEIIVMFFYFLKKD